MLEIKRDSLGVPKLFQLLWKVRRMFPGFKNETIWSRKYILLVCTLWDFLVLASLFFLYDENSQNIGLTRHSHSFQICSVFAAEHQLIDWSEHWPDKIRHINLVAWSSALERRRNATAHHQVNTDLHVAQDQPWLCIQTKERYGEILVPSHCDIWGDMHTTL